MEYLQVNDIDKVYITDGYESMYLDPICIEIDKKSATELLKAILDSNENQSLSSRNIIFSISFLDRTNNLVSKIDVDAYRTIHFDEKKYERIGQIDDILSHIEEVYSLAEKKQNRVPGKEYYQLMKYAEKAYLREMNTNPLDDSLNLQLPEEIIHDMRQFVEKVNISPLRTNSYNIIFVINIYNCDGNKLYTIHLDKNNIAYTSSGYKLYGSFLSDFVKKLTGFVHDLH